MRRYHSNFGGNVFEFMRYQNGYSEPPCGRTPIRLKMHT